MDKKKALETFMTGENFHLQHYLGAHREEKKGNWEQKTAGSLGLGFGCWVEGDFCKGLTMCFRRPDDVFERKSR